MGATIFLLIILIMILLPAAGISAIIFGAFLLITKIKWGKTPAIISISVGCVCMILFAGSLMFLRYANGQPEEGYVDTGTMVEWQGDTFIYQGEKYVLLYDYIENDFWYEPTIDENDLEVVFNIRPERTLWSELFNAHEAENVYKIDSSEGTTLYYNYMIYCPEEKKSQLRKYYDSDKTWTVVVYDKNGKERECPIDVTQSEENVLCDIKKNEGLSLYDSEISDYADIKVKSKDELIEGVGSLVCYGKQWYWDSEETDSSGRGAEEIATIVYEIPESLNEKIVQAVEIED